MGVDPPEAFATELPESFLKPSTPVGLNYEERGIALRMSPQQLALIFDGMRSYTLDTNNTLFPLLAFRNGDLPASLFNYVWNQCTPRKGEKGPLKPCKRVMAIINMAYVRVHFMEISGMPWRGPPKPQPKKK